MIETVKSASPGNRDQLLDAAAARIEAHPGEELSLRAVCADVGVKMPTLYHYFGSKQGLVDAVVARHFERYRALKAEQKPSSNAIDDISAGWDQHVEFGLRSPAIYALMWQVVPGHRTPAAEQALAALLQQTRRAAATGRLVVSAEEAADHVLSSCVGVTLFLITSADHPAGLSDQVRDATVAAITGQAIERDRVAPAQLAADLASALRASPRDALGAEENALLIRWLDTISR
ncbi:TetR/AcrR family transcriptional regulator [Branchiibius cervicis]|uniref:TetR/AcrR family transcriptional regulator n=1 Tax=Branchiibius cervicis TaxID=908252 RepID=A0ABW2AN88_9MICO